MFACRLAAALAVLALLAVAPATAAAEHQRSQTDRGFVVDHDLDQPDMA